MKILLHNRDPKLWVGGDAIQVDNTIKALKKQGIEVNFTSDTFADPRGYDLVHIFHINFFWTTVMMQECIRLKVPYIISTIYFDKEYDNNFGVMKKLAFHARKLIALSSREKQELIDRLGVSKDHVEIVPNGIDKSIFYRQDVDKGNYALYVGRLTDTAKGAIYAVDACRQLRLPLVTIGKSDNTRYSVYCKNNSTHIENLSQQELAKIYSSARVYICSSLSERQSLAVLEAAACGTSVVDSIYNRGADLLTSSVIVDPNDTENLKTAIMQQLDKPNTDFVPSWDDVAKQLIRIYEQQTNS